MSEGPQGWALVTGASSGIGEAFAHVLAREGYPIVLVARRTSQLERVASDLQRTYGVDTVVIAADLAEPRNAEHIVRSAERLGVVSVLVNNAGLTLEGRFLDQPWSSQRAFLEVMALAPCALIHGLLPGMLERRAGVVVNVASVSSSWPSTPTYTLYAGVKSLLVKTTLALAEEYRGSGVTFTAICPGITRTAIVGDGTLAADNASRMPRWLVADPSMVAERSLAAAKAGRTLFVPAGVDQVVSHVVRHVPQVAGSRLIGRWLTGAYDRWRLRSSSHA